MVYLTTTLSSDVSGAFEDNKPVLIGDNVIEAGTAAPVWRTWNFSALSQDYCPRPISGTVFNATDSTYPVERVHDRHAYLQTKPTLGYYTPAVTNDRFSIIFELTDQTIDTIALVNHNLASLTTTYGPSAGGNDLYVEAIIAHDEDFTSYKQTIFKWTNPTTNKPLVALNLSRNWDSSPTLGSAYYEQYKPGVGAAPTPTYYVQISVHCLSAAMDSSNGLPQIGEIIIGKRAQLFHYPVIPYLDRGVGADVEIGDPTTGQVKIYENSSGAQTFENDIVLTGDKSSLVTFFESYIDYGLKPFLYSVKPLSNWSYGGSASAASFTSTPPTAYWMALTDSNFEIIKSNDGPNDFTATITTSEISPYITSFTV